RLTQRMTGERSLAHPDKRFSSMGIYYEGDVPAEDKLEGIKLCIDTSGSMSDKDIAIAVAQIIQLCKLYKTQADLIFWDDGIQSITPFTELTQDDLRNYRAMGRGGTNPNCIFEEFMKKEYTMGTKVKPSLIIIFTDGYIATVESKYTRYFGRDTVWVLCSESSIPVDQFNPTFGKIATFKS
ncbi:MAG: hypothetical protein IJ593_00685, partial [Lachnospiraceae bacterium]|nr:hypothetical protein [Lachnospiraceae bacterium]